MAPATKVLAGATSGRDPPQNQGHARRKSSLRVAVPCVIVRATRSFPTERSSSIGGQMKTKTSWASGSAPAMLALAAVVGSAVLVPRTAHAVNACNGAFQILYPTSANFPEPVPPGMGADDILQ